MIGRRIGQYEIVELLGEGGVGQVYRGRDTVLGRQVAIKTLRPELRRDHTFVTRFRTEALRLADFSHPNITILFQLLEEGQELFMVMELVLGRELETLLEHVHRLPLRESLAVVAQTAAGLAAAHRKGVIHRDIKTSNLKVTESGLLKIMDFGIARDRGSQRMTRAGQMWGTLLYASPEQIRGGDVDERSDLYSLAVVVYEMLAGTPPFVAETDHALMTAHLEMRPPPLAGRVPRVDMRIEAALMRALAKQPDERFSSVDEFSRAIGASTIRGESEEILRDFIAVTFGSARTRVIDTAGVRAAGADERPPDHRRGQIARHPESARGRLAFPLLKLLPESMRLPTALLGAAIAASVLGIGYLVLPPREISHLPQVPPAPLHEAERPAPPTEAPTPNPVVPERDTTSQAPLPPAPELPTNPNPVPRPPPAAPAPVTPTPAPASPTSAPMSQAFADGKRDRLALEQWVDGLDSDAKAGAQWWAEHRSDAEHGAPAAYCNPIVATASEMSWWNGCTTAKAKLAPLDARRRSEPDYKAGWDEASSELQAAPALPPPPAPSPGPAAPKQWSLDFTLQNYTNLDIVAVDAKQSGAKSWENLSETPPPGIATPIPAGGTVSVSFDHDQSDDGDERSCIFDVWVQFSSDNITIRNIDLCRVSMLKLSQRGYQFMYTTDKDYNEKTAQLSSYGAGLRDRTDWERWFAGLSGPFHDGAFWWSAQRSLPQPGVCNGPDSMGNLDFARGCEAAKIKLDPFDLKGKSDPEYRRGWNSYSPEGNSLSGTTAPQYTPPYKSSVLCGHAVNYTVDNVYGGGFIGTWTGVWNNKSRLCGALIVHDIHDGQADLTYIYGPSRAGDSVQWKRQSAVGILRDGVLSFQDDEGSKFRFGLASPPPVGSLDAEFFGAGRLTASFTRIN